MPVMVTVAAPVVAVEEAVSVRVEVALPFAGGVTGLVEKPAVTPLGNPLALNVVAELKPPVLVTVIVLVPLLPWVMVKELGEALTLKAGEVVEVTVSATVVVAVRLPEVPVMVTVAEPVVAVLLAVRVSSLLFSAGFELNFAVTPLGNPDTDNVTAFLSGAIMIVVTPSLPGAMVSLFGEAISVRPAVTVSWTDVV